MNTLNPLAGKYPPLNPHRPSFFKPLSPFSFRIAPPPSSHLSQPAVKASSQNHQNPSKPQNFFKFQFNNETSDSMPVKSTLITTIAAAAIFLSGFHFLTKPSVAAPIPPPPTVGSASNESTPAEEKEKLEQLCSNFEKLVETEKIPEAIKILDKLTELEPEEVEWSLLRALLYAYKGDFQLSRKVFNDMLDKNPTSLEACQGLMIVDSREKSVEEWKQTEKRIEEAIRLFDENTENDAANLKEFKLLRAQICVLQGKFEDALSFFKELEKEEPDDFKHEPEVLRAHLHAHKGDFQFSRKVFNDMLDKYPTSLDACQGLVILDLEEKSVEELKQTEKRIEEAIRLSDENTENAAHLREFKLLRAQICVLQEKFDDALSFLKELEKEEPDDFRVYLCQVLVYMMLNRKSEAEISLEKYKGLVPEGHLFDTYFNDEYLNATAKARAQKVEHERK